MNLTTRGLQARLAALGYEPGPIDGMMGPKTRAARDAALEDHHTRNVADLFHSSGVYRIHWHWSAGAYGVIAMERRAYNGLIDENGNRHDGVFGFHMQGAYAPGRAASHTLNGNSGAGGLCMDAMAGARERPFQAGPNPLTEVQVEEMCRWTAELCLAFEIPVHRASTLSHAEVQTTLGIRQRWKWDVMWLPGMSAPGDPIEVGDMLRDKTRVYLDGLDH